MLQKIVMQLKNSGDQVVTYNWGSLMHGAILELLPLEIAERLHQSSLRPFSQYIIPDSDNRVNWHIGIWDNEIAGILVPTLLSLKSIEIKHKKANLEVIEIKNIIRSYKDYFATFFTQAEICRRYEIEFLTPCTHKRDGRYVIFPGIDLIILSLSRKYSEFSSEFSLNDPEVTQELIKHMQIVRYSLRTGVYHLDGTKITGYVGKITIQIRGPEQLARLAGSLLSFGEYSGLGIKTALGMGGIRVIPIGLNLSAAARKTEKE